jgi:hemerythrin-like domain-containing protein
MVGRIIDTVKEDHGTIEACYTRIIDDSKRDEQIRFQNLFTWELARNLVGKELVVYPALEKHLPDGAALASKNRNENHIVRGNPAELYCACVDNLVKIKEDLKKFQSLDPSNSEYVPAINSLMNHLRQHTTDEERNQLPKLEETLSEKESDHLSKAFSRTKIFLPTRAHPDAPSKPPFETAVGLMTAPFDQLADLFRKWPHHT